MSNERASLVDPESKVGAEPLSGRRVFDEWVRPVVAEGVAMTLFVFVGVLSTLEAGGAGSAGFNPAFSPVAVAVGHGLAIAMLVAAFGDVSGAHINPVVTLTAMLVGALPPLKAVLYVAAQLLGSMAGAALVRGVLPRAAYLAIGGGAGGLGHGVAPAQAVLCEAVLTAILLTVILMTAVDSRTRTSLAPLAIGFAVVVGILAGMQVSGASLNPARMFGPAVVISDLTHGHWATHWVYWLGPLLGVAIATAWYRLLLASPEHRLTYRRLD